MIHRMFSSGCRKVMVEVVMAADVTMAEVVMVAEVTPAEVVLVVMVAEVMEVMPVLWQIPVVLASSHSIKFCLD